MCHKETKLFAKDMCSAVLFFTDLETAASVQSVMLTSLDEAEGKTKVSITTGTETKVLHTSREIKYNYDRHVLRAKKFLCTLNIIVQIQ